MRTQEKASGGARGSDQKSEQLGFPKGAGWSSRETVHASTSNSMGTAMKPVLVICVVCDLVGSFLRSMAAIIAAGGAPSAAAVFLAHARSAASRNTLMNRCSLCCRARDTNCSALARVGDEFGAAAAGDLESTRGASAFFRAAGSAEQQNKNRKGYR